MSLLKFFALSLLVALVQAASGADPRHPPMVTSSQSPTESETELVWPTSTSPTASLHSVARSSAASPSFYSAASSPSSSSMQHHQHSQDFQFEGEASPSSSFRAAPDESNFGYASQVPSTSSLSSRPPRRQLINFNKLKLENLVALEMLMFVDRYEHAHIIFNGISDRERATGHFYNWMEAFGRKRKGLYGIRGLLAETLPRFTTYGGRESLAHAEWDETTLLGIPQSPDVYDIKGIRITPAVTYDIHQAAVTSLQDHEFLHARIIENGGRVGTVFLQLGRDTRIKDSYESTRDYHRLVKEIYGDDAERVIVLDEMMLDKRVTTIFPSALKGKVPRKHLDLALQNRNGDALGAEALLAIDKYLYGGVYGFRFLPEELRDALQSRPYDWNERKAEKYNSNVRIIQTHLHAALAGKDKRMRDSILSWIATAQARTRSIQDVGEEVRANMEQLAQLVTDLQNKQPEQVDFADPLFTVVLLEPTRYDAKYLAIYEGVAEGEASFHGSPANAMMDFTDTSSGIVGFNMLPTEELIGKALDYIPRRHHGTGKSKARTWLNKVVRKS